MSERDDLARHLYIHSEDDDGATQAWRDAGARDWDAGNATAADVAAYYADADQILAQEAAS